MRSKPSSAGSTGRGADGSVNVRELDREAAAHLHRVLAGRHELRRACRDLEGIHVCELPLGVVTMLGLAHRRAEDLAVAESPARHLSAELDVLRVALRIGLLVVENERSN